MYLYQSPFNSFNNKNPDREQRIKYCTLLEQEYRGDRILIDDVNIDAKYRQLVNTAKIKAAAVYVPIVRTFTDEENNNYDNGTIRQFRHKGGKALSKKNLQYIEDLYVQSQYNLQAIQWEHEAALFGTVMIRPAFDERTGLLHWVRLIPSDATLTVRVDEKFSNIASEIIYVTGKSKDQIQDTNQLEHVWDWESYKVYKLNKNGQRTSNETPVIDVEHGFKETEASKVGGMPWTILRYSIDNRAFWGPFDGGLASIATLRSFLLADAVHRTQVSLFEILVMAGYNQDEALKAVSSMQSGKIMIAEKGKKGDGGGEPFDQDPHYISPEGMEPSKVLEIFMKIYDFVRQTRGHSKKNFEVGAKVQSFEAQRLADNVLKRKQLQNRPFLLAAEQRNLRLLVHENNKISGNPRIPEDIEVTLDWVDRMSFANMKELSEFAVVAVQKNWMTDPQVIKKLNPDLTEEQAMEQFEENKIFNEKNRTQPVDNTEEIEQNTNNNNNEDEINESDN